MTRKRGFTLIEMIVLIFIIAIMSATVVPSYSRFLSKSRFQSSVESVMNLLAWAHTTAVQTGGNVVVKFDTQSQTLAAVGQQPDQNQDVPSVMQNDPSLTTVQPMRSATLGDVSAVANYQVNTTGTESAIPGMQQQGPSPTQDLTFYPDGTSDEARIVIVSPNRDAAEIDVLPATGHAEIAGST